MKRQESLFIGPIQSQPVYPPNPKPLNCNDILCHAGAIRRASPSTFDVQSWEFDVQKEGDRLWIFHFTRLTIYGNVSHMHAIVTSKNQITVPEPIRRTMKLSRGDHLIFEPVEEGWILRSKTKNQRKSDGAAKQWVKRETPMTVPEMKEAAAKQAGLEYFGSAE